MPEWLASLRTRKPDSEDQQGTSNDPNDLSHTIPARSIFLRPSFHAVLRTALCLRAAGHRSYRQRCRRRHRRAAATARPRDRDAAAPSLLRRICADTFGAGDFLTRQTVVVAA